jgi:hypothetical protein
MLMVDFDYAKQIICWLISSLSIPYLYQVLLKWQMRMCRFCAQNLYGDGVYNRRLFSSAAISGFL